LGNDEMVSESWGIRFGSVEIVICKLGNYVWKCRNFGWEMRKLRREVME